jgi:VWFA-related protein
MRALWRLLAVVFGLGWIVPAPHWAQVMIEPRSTPAAHDVRQRASIRVDTELVLVPVTVCDPLNRPVTGLEKDNFRIFDDRIEQTVTHFGMDDEPLAVGLVFDASGSMGNKMRKARMSAAAFFKTANPEDEFFLVQFNDRPKLISGLTSDIEELQNRLAFTQARGRTALLDAIYLSLQQMKKSRKQRKALLIISDGGDNSSRFSEAEVRSLVRESDVLIYAIGIFEPTVLRPRTIEEFSGPSLLTEIAEHTGGRHFRVDNLNELPDIAARIGVELRNRYVLGFSPTSERDGRYHRLHVRVDPPPGGPQLRVFWRAGYYAPAD